MGAGLRNRVETLRRDAYRVANEPKADEEARQYAARLGEVLSLFVATESLRAGPRFDVSTLIQPKEK